MSHDMMGMFEQQLCHTYFMNHILFCGSMVCKETI